jgi:ATP-binding cassette subfamily C protein
MVNIMTFLGLEVTLGTLLIVVVVSISLKSVLMLVATRHVGYSAAHIATDLRLELLQAILSTRWGYFQHQRTGRLANAMATEANRASQSYLYGVTMLALFVQAAVYISIALTVSWQTTLAAFVTGAVILSISHLLVRMARKAGKRQTKMYKSLLARLTDILQSVKSLKAMAREELADTVLSKETAKLNKALQGEVFSKAILDAVQLPVYVAVAAIGIYVAIEHWQVNFTTVMVLAILLVRSLNQLGKIQKQYQKLVTTESAFWSIRQSIDDAMTAREIDEGSSAPTPGAGIRLDNVSFAHDDKPVLNDISLTIPPRALTTIVGASGSGKTTLIDLVIGLLRPDEGTIYLGDTPLREIDKQQWRRQIGYVPQEQVLLHDSVLTNVTFGDPELTEADAEQALKSAGAWDFVSSMPHGIHSSVGERGTMLSGGQRQRIMIARALAHKPSVLILDEPTSALDPDSEKLISNTLHELGRNYTVVAISHQQALVDAADQVYRLVDGRITEQTD